MSVSDPAIAAAIESEISVHDGVVLGDAISIRIPIDLLAGATSPALQALALDEETESSVADRLPDAADGAEPLVLLPPQLPSCTVATSPVAPGTSGRVDATGFAEDAPARVVLAGDVIGEALADGAGNASIPFLLPAGAVPGSRAISVRGVGSGLLAACSFDVSGAPPPPLLSPDVSRNDPGQEHTVTATLVDGAGDPASGIAVAFSVDAGPNAGAAGVCSMNEDCTSDEQGLVSFTYTSDGSTGVDRISASFTDAGGSLVTTNTVLKFWDGDCNQNDVADTCDIDCAGFAGLCRAELTGSCGSSADENADGFPDECNRPPDCSMAGAEPDELWPPLHQMKEIGVGGVTDEDGDPVDVRVTSVFQDEPTTGQGQGDLAPDAGPLGGATVQVRVERLGTVDAPGDGRVYHVGFTADDGQGGECSGEVTVCVPHDQRPGHACIDQGPLHDSSALALFGRAAGGGSVTITIDGEHYAVATRPGDSAAQVMASLASAIRAGGGAEASSDGHALIVSGTVTSFSIDDAGLAETAIEAAAPVPMLGSKWLAAVAALLLAALGWALRQRASATDPRAG